MTENRARKQKLLKMVQDMVAIRFDPDSDPSITSFTVSISKDDQLYIAETDGPGLAKVAYSYAGEGALGLKVEEQYLIRQDLDEATKLAATEATKRGMLSRSDPSWWYEAVAIETLHHLYNRFEAVITTDPDGTRRMGPWKRRKL